MNDRRLAEDNYWGWHGMRGQSRKDDALAPVEDAACQEAKRRWRNAADVLS